MTIKRGLVASRLYATCFACGAKYHPKYFYTANSITPASDHVCDPRRIKKRDQQLRHQFDDEPPYCDCDDIDCKFEFLESLKNGME
jgi:hypothetical protein